MTVGILANGLREFARFVDSIPKAANEAAFFAVTDTTRDAMPVIRKEMSRQINFPNGYLNTERLGVRRKPTRTTLEAVISGRDRPTSLARFAEGATVANSRGRPVFVRVKAGRQVKLQRAFLLDLKNGNQGLAIRLPAGQAPDAAYKPVQLTRFGGKPQDVWLLYGPSVDQVLKGVIPDVSPQIQDMLSRNWLRHFSRLTSRG